MQSTSIQVQCVLYNNTQEDIARSVLHLATAVQTAQAQGVQLRVTLCHGDASPMPLFAEEEYRRLAAPYAASLAMEYRYFDENTGHAKGQNLLAQSCQSDYILILNPDVVVGAQLFPLLLAPLARVKAGIAEARQTPLEHPKAYDENTGQTTWATGACMLVRSDVFRQVGGFAHELFFMHGDDVDFSWRVRQAGYGIYYQPAAPVFHPKRLSAAAAWQPSHAEQYYAAEAALLLRCRWGTQQQVDEMVRVFETTPMDSPARDAVRRFLQRRQEGALPPAMENARQIASFSSEGYGSYRFSL